MTTSQFGFSKLIVADLEKSVTFYKDVCGFTELARVDAEIEGRAIREIMFTTASPGAATFVLLNYPDAPQLVQGETILGIITSDVAGFVKKAERAGGRVVQMPKTMAEHGVKVAFVRDNEGHLIEVVEMLAK